MKRNILTASVVLLTLASCAKKSNYNCECTTTITDSDGLIDNTTNTSSVNLVDLTEEEAEAACSNSEQNIVVLTISTVTTCDLKEI